MLLLKKEKKRGLMVSILIKESAKCCSYSINVGAKKKNIR